MKARGVKLAWAAVLLWAFGTAHAVPQAPHDAASGITCSDCHIPYASLQDPTSSEGVAGFGSNVSQLVDSTKSWVPDFWVGAVITFGSGANEGQYRTIAGNTETTIWWMEPLSTPVEIGTTYRLGKTTYEDIETKCKSCHNPTGRASATSRVGLHVVQAGDVVVGCGKCHEPHNVEPNSGPGHGLVRETIQWPTVRSPVAYPGSDANRFIAGGPSYNGVCEVCHTETDQHRNNNSANHTHYASWTCTWCHAHDAGFRPICGVCHRIPPTPATEDYAGGGGAHARHVTDLRFVCETCHDGAKHSEGVVVQSEVQVAFAPQSFPGGTTAENGGLPIEDYAGGNPTCQVGCHNPVPAEPAETPNLDNLAVWTAGPLGCTRCHDTQGQVMRNGTVNGTTYRSGHSVTAASTEAERAECQGCHDISAHLDGDVRVTPQDGSVFAVTGAGPAELDPLCQGCHDGVGGSIGDRAPPNTVAAYASSTGDFHGSRTGAGWGGTLKVPYTRGSAPLPCATCHDEHGSPHAYGFRPTVNGTLLATPISRNGAGAEALCTTCHAGTYHGGCIDSGCHGSDPVPPPQPCFYCHSHNGISQWPNPRAEECQHCHDPWYPRDIVSDLTAPVIVAGPTVVASATYATFTWTTDTAASSYVEWGMGAACCTNLFGSGALVTSHRVTVTGLSPESLISYRVQSRDAARNEAASAIASFETAFTDPPAVPILVAEPDVASATPVTVVLEWYPSIDPNGDPVEYLIQVADAPGFDSPTHESGWIGDTLFVATVAPNRRHYFRVMARDAAHPSFASEWSGIGTFAVSEPPPAPLLVDEPDLVSDSPPSIGFDWGPVLDPNGDPVQYQVEVDDDPGFASINYRSSWQSATTYTQTLATGRSYVWRVVARDGAHPTLTSISAADGFTVAVTRPPSAPAVVPQPEVVVPRPVALALAWSAVTDPDGDPVEYLVQMDDSADFSSPSAESGWIAATSFTVTVSEAPRYYFRVRARDAAHPTYTSAWSDVGSFPVNRAPPTPGLVHQPDVASTEPVSLTLGWGSVSDPDGDAVEYRVEVDDGPDFASLTHASGWTTTTSFALTCAPGPRYFWRVVARDTAHPLLVSAWTPLADFGVVAAAAPPAPVGVDEPDYNSNGTVIAVTLAWGAVVSPDSDPVEYQVQLDDAAGFLSVDFQSLWVTGTSWTVTLPIQRLWRWRVRARDAGHTASESPFSATDTFMDWFSSSCPFVYVWDGTEFMYQTDIQGEILGLPPDSSGAKSVALYGPSAIVLGDLQPNSGNEYVIKVRETLSEIDYFDEAKLLVVDHPEGTQVASSSAQNTYTFGLSQPLTLYSLREPVPPLSAYDRFGTDILESLVACDGAPAPADPDELEAYTLDFGTIARPEEAKLVLDAWSIYGAQLRGPVPVPPTIELLSPEGSWIEVTSFGPAAGDLKTMVVDLRGLLFGTSAVVRVNLGVRSGARWAIDCARLDDSVPAPLTVTELPAASADLHHRGAATYSMATLSDRIYASDDENPDDPIALGTGRFTRYGDVLPLLSALDDKFVIMMHGDEVELAFAAPTPPGPGAARTLLLKADVSYKGRNRTVEPLPFHGMSSYPYPETESYPLTPDREAYLIEYNTREVPAP